MCARNIDTFVFVYQVHSAHMFSRMVLVAICIDASFVRTLKVSNIVMNTSDNLLQCLDCFCRKFTLVALESFHGTVNSSNVSSEGTLLTGCIPTNISDLVLYY
jgi:hypothetical protein